MSVKKTEPLELGVIGQRHHAPITNVLDAPIAKGRGKKFPSTMTALLAINCDGALKGNKKAIKRVVKRLKAHELKKLRYLNSQPQVLSFYENEDFERVDEALDILKLSVPTDYIYEIQLFADDRGGSDSRKVWTEQRRTGPGVPDWLLEAARQRPECSKAAYRHVTRWIWNGGLGPHRQRDDFDRWNNENREEFVPLRRSSVREP